MRSSARIHNFPSGHPAAVPSPTERPVKIPAEVGPLRTADRPGAGHAPMDGPAATKLNPVHQWRVDLKWVCGIPFTFFLLLAVAVLAMFQATDREHAEQTIAAANQPLVTRSPFTAEARTAAPQLMAFLDSPDFARTIYDDPGALEAQIDAVPDPAGMAQPPAGADAQTQPSAGAEVQAQLSEAGDSSQVQGMKSLLRFYAAPLQIMSVNVHETLGAMLTVLIVLLALFGIPYIALSRRVGRMVSPGVSLAIASLGPFALVGFIKGAFDNWVATGGVSAAANEQTIREIIQPLGAGLIEPVFSVYRTAVIVSLLLLVVAGLIKLALKLRSRMQSDGLGSNRKASSRPARTA